MVFPPPLVMWGVGASEAIILTVGVSAAEIYTVTAQYGGGQYTYSLTPENIGIEIDGDGVLSLDDDNAQAGVYAVTVRVEDKERSHAEIIINIEIRSIALADAPLLEALARLSVEVSLHTFVASGGVGSKRYTIIAGNKAGYFALDADSGELSLPSNSAMLAGAYTLRVEVSDSLLSPQRATAAATVRIAKNGIFVMGGMGDGDSFPRDVWLSLDGKNWSKQSDDAAWPETYNHQVASHQGRLYLLDGGNNPGVWSSAAGKSWSSEGNQDWLRRSQFQVVEYKDRLYAMGGNVGMDGRRNDVWSWADGESWMLVTMTAAWSARQWHQVVVHNDRMYLLGGYGLVGGNNGSLDDVWSSADGSSWSFEGNANWSGRFAHQAVSHQGRLYVLGGMGAGSDVWSWAVGEENWTRETQEWLADKR